MTTARFTLVQRLLHWLIALLVFGLLAIGLIFMTLGFDGTLEMFGQTMTNNLYKYHKTFGIVLFLLMILRLGWRLKNPPPAYQQPLTKAESMISRGTHLSIYLLLFGLPIGGALATAMSGYPVEFFDWNLPALVGENKALGAQLFVMHGIAGLILLALVVLHIAAAIKHWLLKDGVMQRITLP